jgi:hypothetical protein
MVSQPPPTVVGLVFESLEASSRVAQLKAEIAQLKDALAPAGSRSEWRPARPALRPSPQVGLVTAGMCLTKRPCQGTQHRTEMLFRQGLLQQPVSIDDPAEGASWDVVGRRALLVVRIEGAPRQPVRLVWYATRPATLSPYADLAEAFAHHTSLALEAVMERDNLNRAVAARHGVGVAQGILMTRRRLTAEQAFTLL